MSGRRGVQTSQGMQNGPGKEFPIVTGRYLKVAFLAACLATFLTFPPPAPSASVPSPEGVAGSRRSQDAALGGDVGTGRRGALAAPRRPQQRLASSHPERPT